jgi:hypothetical protein
MQGFMIIVEFQSIINVAQMKSGSGRVFVVSDKLPAGIIGLGFFD